MQKGNNNWTDNNAIQELSGLLISIVDLQAPSAEKHATGVATLVTKLGEPALMTSYRSYRPKTIYSPTEALDVLRQNRHCFDLSLLDAFVDLVETEL
jgi:hypothetical protein